MRERPNAADLLAWYDTHARVMPWRVPPQDRKAGIMPDPYHVWLSEVMLQQTTVVTVRDYFRRFVTRWPTVTDLAGAADAQVMGEWAGLGYYARARNLLKCARAIVAQHAGRFPETREGLLALPGIGPYTASAISSIAFDRQETVVDGNVERVMARLFAVQTPLPPAKAELTGHAATLTPGARPGDYAQAVMDLGATICTPRSPACGICPWRDPCVARAKGIASELPRKVPKKAKPTRRGIAWVARRQDGAWLLETRPERGLLGGLLAWPSHGWDGTEGPGTAPIDAPWQTLGEVRHTFTHFHLILEVRAATVDAACAPARGSFMDPSDFRPSDLPTLMRKVFDLASGGRTGVSQAPRDLV